MDKLDSIKAFIMSNFVLGRDSVTDVGHGDSLAKLGLIDSTGVLELIAFLESEFSIAVADEEIIPENLDSISQIGQFVTRKQAAL